MSVYKTQRKEGELLAITKARDAAEYTMKITHNEKGGPHKERISRPKKANTRRATPAAALSWQQATRARTFEI